MRFRPLPPPRRIALPPVNSPRSTRTTASRPRRSAFAISRWKMLARRRPARMCLSRAKTPSLRARSFTRPSARSLASLKRITGVCGAGCRPEVNFIKPTATASKPELRNNRRSLPPPLAIIVATFCGSRGEPTSLPPFPSSRKIIHAPSVRASHARSKIFRRVLYALTAQAKCFCASAILASQTHRRILALQTIDLFIFAIVSRVREEKEEGGRKRESESKGFGRAKCADSPVLNGAREVIHRGDR